METPETKPPPPTLNNVVMQFYQLGRRDALKAMIDVMEMPQLKDAAFTTKQIIDMLNQAQGAPVPEMPVTPAVDPAYHPHYDPWRSLLPPK